LIAKRVAWATLAAASLAVSAPALAEENGRGAELFELCVQCHGAEGEGDPLALAPAIAGLDDWYLTTQLEHFRSGARGMHPDDLAGMRMHPMSLTLKDDADLQAVAAYVASLPPTRPERTLDGDPQRGQALYVTCAACHGPDGGGLEALGAPAINSGSDWYLLKQLQHFKSGIRGANPAADPTGARMRPMAMVLADEQAMKDVIAYALTLGNQE
jgi:cytochrome c oxidase subunit 2